MTTRYGSLSPAGRAALAQNNPALFAQLRAEHQAREAELVEETRGPRGRGQLHPRDLDVARQRPVAAHVPDEHRGDGSGERVSTKEYMQCFEALYAEINSKLPPGWLAAGFAIEAARQRGEKAQADGLLAQLIQRGRSA